MIYLRTKLHMPSSSDSLVNAIKQKAKLNVHTAGMLLHIIKKEN
jgi:hypothetical protein